MSKYNNINVKSYIESNEISKKDKAIKNQSDDEVQNESEEIQNIKQRKSKKKVSIRNSHFFSSTCSRFTLIPFSQLGSS